MKTVRKVYKAQKVNMGGIILDQALPLRGLEMIDPVLLIHHWSDRLPGGKKQSEVGVGPHPHRGFSPVSFIFKGGVHHRDSEGNEEVVNAGGTQWMNSGKGIVHSERPSKEVAEQGGDFELIQFWINSPASEKMNPPSYQPLHEKDTPTYISADKKVNIGVVNGTYKGKTGPIAASSELLILRMELQQGGKESMVVPKHYNTLIYVLDGTITVNDDTVLTNKEMAHFRNDGDDIAVEATADARAILLSGVPLKESVSSYGPFVMNTQREIMDAIEDYNSGKMGQLIETFE